MPSSQAARKSFNSQHASPDLVFDLASISQTFCMSVSPS
eukprot:CAMPEP_0183797046 /NCGR_PEP_ID=MMETSP0803_2-20130417/14204_1 /TAXON_ID=195967 /ORGANISM="Crustomastix stigmata, Strain CCMP3273" /LENGTH=38 /DNA_ID= /DNA_START= /DNA_END= /DNA_ORIENTATION=